MASRVRHKPRERWAPTAMSPAGRIKHFRINPERVEIVCSVCGRTVMRCQSDIYRGMAAYCDPWCRTVGRKLALMLLPRQKRSQQS